MPNRSQDWLEQGRHDLNHARHAGDHDWACFAAHQAAEKAVKALILSLNGEGWGHTITKLLQDVRPHTAWDEAQFENLLQAARQLDKHYIPTRYPNGFDAGAPVDYYTNDDADRALQDAQRVYRCAGKSATTKVPSMGVWECGRMGVLSPIRPHSHTLSRGVLASSIEGDTTRSRITPRLFTTRSSSRFLNLDAAIDELRTCAERLKTECDVVRAVYLFGSLAAGTATPRSDADVLVEVSDDTPSTDAVEDTARRVFADGPLPADLFVRPSHALTSDSGIIGAAKRHHIQLA